MPANRVGNASTETGRRSVGSFGLSSHLHIRSTRLGQARCTIPSSSAVHPRSPIKTAQPVDMLLLDRIGLTRVSDMWGSHKGAQDCRLMQIVMAGELPRRIAQPASAGCRYIHGYFQTRGPATPPAWPLRVLDPWVLHHGSWTAAASGSSFHAQAHCGHAVWARTPPIARDHHR